MLMRVGRVALRVGAAPVVTKAAQRLDEGEDLVPDRGEHLLRGHLLEPRPAQGVLVLAEDRFLDGAAGAGGLALAQRMQLVEPLDEEQVGELLDDGERVRDAAGPHAVPDAVDFGLDFTGDHGVGLLVPVVMSCSVRSSQGGHCCSGLPGTPRQALVTPLGF